MDARDAVLREWSDRLEFPTAGHWTVNAIQPVIKEWVGRQFGVVSFHLTQVLSGHGCFGKYLCERSKREPTPACHHCNSIEDTAQHTLAECPGWEEHRNELVAVVGGDLSLQAIIKTMTQNKTCFKAMISFCEAVMAEKELAERAREEDIDAHPLRRKRAGRRRVAHDRRLPP
ncbi:uncharacterized protein LOC125225989 [Leguminivora glycinivorella]|uniref:uncharacterized protein LOC125225989 n=1 Tax=Leguminivora glycinivorella TaxID=1035111 RepID=UPI00200CA776|nr:uncharacterized protein LOC125225989 [Leguminivora glycinivorella]